MSALQPHLNKQNKQKFGQSQGTRWGLSSVIILTTLLACGPPPASESHPSPTTSPSARSTPSPTPLPSADSSNGASSGENPPIVQPTVGPSVFVSPVSGLRFEGSKRFLSAKGDKMRIYLTLLDPQGQPLSAAAQSALKIDWLSSNPQVISVDPAGFIQALADSGQATIIARLSGTTYEVQTLINVYSSGGGSGGGGSSSSGSVPTPVAPIIQSLSLSETSIIGAGSLVSLVATASFAGVNLQESDYIWSCQPTPCGTFFPASGSSVYWQAPDQTGSFTIVLSVTKDGVQVSQSAQLNLTVGQGSVSLNP